MKIDVHSHIVGEQYFKELAALPGMTEVEDPYEYALVRDGKKVVPVKKDWFDPDRTIRDMDDRGIDVRLLSLSTPNLYIFPPDRQGAVAQRVNDELFERCRAHPDRLKGLASLPMGDIEATMKELDRVGDMKEIVAGIAMGSNVAGTPLSDERFEPVWQRINDERWPVVEHPMHPSFAQDLQDMNMSIRFGFMFDTQLMLARMIYAGIFERYPDFPFVVAHTGAGMLGLLHRLDGGLRTPEIAANIKKKPSDYAKNLYYDSCAFFEPTLMMALDLVGADHLMFGTDFPFVETGSEHIDQLRIDDSTREQIRSGTAASIFGIAA